LEPHARYRLKVAYCTERNNPRTQTLFAGEVTIHPELVLPEGEVRTYEFDLPPDVATQGTIDLSFRHVQGPNAVVSELWLLSNLRQPLLSLSVESDLRGQLVVRAFDGLLQPQGNARVTIVGPGGLQVEGQTDHEGHVRFDLAPNLSREVTGELTITVRSGPQVAKQTIPIDAVIFRRPVLTPLPQEVAGVRQATLSLCGQWRFSPAPPPNFWSLEVDDRQWPPIEVPGEWVMQGFNVAPNTPAAYRFRFRPPADWRGQTVKIRFDAVYSLARVWLNGKPVGEHLGGFTPFEVEVTEALQPGTDNLLALAVTNESLADSLATGSQYARHPLGGITRKVTAFAVSLTHLTRFHADTTFDPAFRNAALRVLAEIAGPLGETELRVALRDPEGRALELRGNRGYPRPNGTVEWQIPVPEPKKWDAEHPNLYHLDGELLVAGQVVERVSRRIGFRQVEIRGRELLINGRPVKLRGVCRHEVHPKRGRSLTPEIWQRDVELLQGANVNHVRTAHYPPAEEFLDRCDEAGLFVQEEAPWCWVSADAAQSSQTLPLLLRSTVEMLERDRSHPCVIFWDLANESAWGPNFQRVHEYARAADPSRPTLFSDGGGGGSCEIASWHYPGPAGPDRTAHSDRPVIFDEYCHLNCYNPAEVTADPGLRDYWGRALQPMWDAMWVAPACLGGAIWSWCDDVFDLPQDGRVGYGEWGPIDGWRRPKPEWWHLKKVYSPVRISLRTLPFPETGQPLLIPVENRFDFTHLNEIRCEWQWGSQKGTVRADVAPRTTGQLVIPAPVVTGETLHLRFLDPAGRVVDEYALTWREQAEGRTEPPGPPPPLREMADSFEAAGEWFRFTFDRQTGRMRARIQDDEVIVGGPWLAASRLGEGTLAFAEDEETAAQSVSAQLKETCVVIHTTKANPFGSLTYTVSLFGDGSFETHYELHYRGPEAHVREIGLVWNLPASFDQLSWQRRGQWTVYPEDHIGRLVGETRAFPVEGASEQKPPSWAWNTDPRGSNDFRSTKYNILEATLTNRQGLGLMILSDGTQHVRATVEGNHLALRVNDFSNGGGERFLQAHYGREYRTVKAGDVLKGTVRARLLKAEKRHPLRFKRRKPNG